MANLHEDQYIFFISSRLVLLRMRKNEMISFG